MKTLIKRTVAFGVRFPIIHRTVFVPLAFRGPNHDYQKFVMLAHLRSGSTLLINSLRQHLQTVVFHEIFNQRKVGFQIDGYHMHSRMVRWFRHYYPIDFLESMVFGSYPDHVKAVGFKIFPEHLQYPQYLSIYDWLECNTNVNVIVLKRKNALASYVSKVMAQKTGKWSIHNPAERPEVTINLDRSACERWFEQRAAMDQKAIRRLNGHNTYHLVYEDFVENFDEHITQIQKFLGLAVQPVTQQLVKVNVRPLSEVIQNYQELYLHFSDTQWAHYFEE